MTDGVIGIKSKIGSKGRLRGKLRRFSGKPTPQSGNQSDQKVVGKTREDEIDLVDVFF